MARTLLQQKPALDLIEDAVDLLRSDPLHFLLPYYMGSLPFFLAFLFFVTDMQSAVAEQHLVPASLGLAALFIAMKFGQSVFASRINDRAAGVERTRFPVKSVLDFLGFQALIHASGFIVLPLSLLATLPYVFMVAFYQNALVPGNERDSGLRAGIGRLWTLAVFAPRQNHVMYLIFLFIRLLIILNIGILIYTAPRLMKSFFDVESAFTLGGFAVMNSTFVVTVLVLSHLISDPLFKAVHALRCFYAGAEKTGADLKAELAALTGKKAAFFMVPLVFLALAVFSPFSPAEAASAEPVGRDSVREEAAAVTPEDLEQSIGHVIQRREFAWRMPRGKERGLKKEGPFAGAMAWLKPHVTRITHTLSRWFDALGRWLKKILPEPGDRGIVEKQETRPLARVLLFLLLALTVCVLVFGILRFFLKARLPERLEAGDQRLVPDLADEATRADDLPPSAWRQLAVQLMEKGEYRLALRALFFETLSCLSEKGLLSIAPFKSNREYHRELAMKAHEKHALLDLFGRTVTFVDRVWYGDAGLGKSELNDFAADQERITGYV